MQLVCNLHHKSVHLTIATTMTREPLHKSSDATIAL